MLPLLGGPTDGDFEAANLFPGEFAPLARRELVVDERADASPDQTNHPVIDGLAHPSNLSIAAFVDRDPQQVGFDGGDPGGGGGPVLQLDPVAEGSERSSRGLASICSV